MNVFSMIEKCKEDFISTTHADFEFLANTCSTSEGIAALTEIFMREVSDENSHEWYLRNSLAKLIYQSLRPGMFIYGDSRVTMDDFIQFVRGLVSGVTWQLAVKNGKFVLKHVIRRDNYYDKVYPTTSNPMSLILAAKANSAWVLAYVEPDGDYGVDDPDIPLDTTEVDKLFEPCSLEDIE